MIRLILATLTYGVAFHYAYVTYLNPTFEYAHFTYFAPALGSIILTYFLLIAPLMAFRASEAVAAAGAALIFALCYVPAELTLAFTWQRSFGELAAVQMALAISMAVMFRVSSVGYSPSGPVHQASRVATVVSFLTFVAIVIIVVTYREYMRLVGFGEVYDLRFETNELETGRVAGYLLSWLVYCFVPYLISRGILERRVSDTIIGVMGALVVYASSGAKAAVLMPGIVFLLYLLRPSADGFAFRLIAALAFGIVASVVLIPDEGALAWVKSILLLRVVGTTGWTTAVYYDYFTTNGLTYYTHIGPVSAIFGGYPYGDTSLGQTIGLHYSGSIDANFNANFWASDAFAALGLLGVPVATAAMGAVFIVLNRLASGYRQDFVVMWLAGFWLALLNLPLTTALMSGGGALTMLLLWLGRTTQDKAPVIGPTLITAHRKSS